MASGDQLRGALLEEIALWLLRRSGYRPVLSRGSDPTLTDMAGGLGVRGRGTDHQVDAIGDFLFGPPFGHPIRLLVEGKAYRRKSVPVSVVREAVGVLQDVQQYWTVNESRPRRARYHYQIAIFSATSFSLPAQQLAFAHDVFLFPMLGSRFFHPILREIEQAAERLRRDFPGRGRGSRVAPSEVRQAMRAALGLERDVPPPPGILESLGPLIREARELGGGLIGMAARAFPLFLVPGADVDITELAPTHEVQIGIRDGQWFLRDPGSGALLFSFDLPQGLLSMYASEGVIDPARAVDLKAEYLNEIHAFVLGDDGIRTQRFVLEHGWLERLQVRRVR